MKKVSIIGAGFSGLSAACYLAKAGYDVTIFEKNDQPGGRARTFAHNGFSFDMGPTWYWMPDIFDSFFNDFGKKTSDFYHLKRINPSYRMYFAENDFVDVPHNLQELSTYFETIEQGAGKKLYEFLDDAKVKYDIGIGSLKRLPGLSVSELLHPDLMLGALKLSIFSSFFKHARKYFKHPKIIQIIEFPVLFLGAMPEKIPALYSLMNYADLVLGTWYPVGGISQISKGMANLAQELGVKIQYNSEVSEITVDHNTAQYLLVNNKKFKSDFILSAADYQHTESKLLDKKHHSYTEKYWESRTMAPSALIYYVGVDKKLENLEHHNLFCDTELRKHASDIYIDPKWPSDPLFYVCCSSKNDKTAPEGKENLYILMPLAPDLKDSDSLRKKYFEIIISRIEKIADQPFKNDILFVKSYCINDFKSDYHAFKGNAYGLANTLSQTANLKPKIRSKKIKNLYFSGQLTVPGPGIPPAIISGNLVANEIIKQHS